MYASCPVLFCRFCCLDAWIFITWILGASKDRISTNAGKMGSEPTPASKSQDSARGFGEPGFFWKEERWAPNPCLPAKGKTVHSHVESQVSIRRKAWVGEPRRRIIG